MIDRRIFLQQVTAAGMIAAGCRPSDNASRLLRKLGAYPFSLGVASGDPTPTGVVLWTRLAPDPLRGGGMPPEAVNVNFEVSTDEQFSRVVKRGAVAAVPESAHSVHVELEGLDPDRWYWYRFIAGGEASPVGRTRTMPVLSSNPERMRFAVASCQHFEHGFYTAYRHMAQQDFDLVLHLGDYIYETSVSPVPARLHTGTEPTTVDEYRLRYAQYKLDRDLQAAHHSAPWIVTWDDHEFDNNYAGVFAEDFADPEQFLIRRAAAYQVYYENMPLRRSALPNGPDMKLYRTIQFGGLADFHVLDTRQYRSDQSCGDRRKPVCDEWSDPERTFLGNEQEAWLMDRLDKSAAKWNAIPQQVLMADVNFGPGNEVWHAMDKWGGYPVARERLLRFLDQRKPTNPVVLTGDIHSSWVNDVRIDPTDLSAPVVATEFVGTSITSGGDGVDMWDTGPMLLAKNPQIKYYNSKRGYMACELTPERWTTEFKRVDAVTNPNGTVTTHATFVVEDGTPGAQSA